MVFFIQNEIIIPWDLSDPKTKCLAEIVETPIKSRLRQFSEELIRISKFGSGPDWYNTLNNINRAFALAQIALGTYYIEYSYNYPQRDKEFVQRVNELQKQKYLELGRRLSVAIRQHCLSKDIPLPQILQ